MSDAKKIALNTLAVGFVATLFVLAFTWIIVDYMESPESLKDAWGVTGGVFGGVATLIAAYIATQLFNDWRDQHNKQVLAYDAKDAFELFYIQRDCIYSLKHKIESILNNDTKLSWKKIATEYEKNLVSLYCADKDKMSAFCYLSEGQLVYNLTMDYYRELESLSTTLKEKADMPFSTTAFLDRGSAARIFSLLIKLELKNSKILKELKTYIFVKK